MSGKVKYSLFAAFIRYNNPWKAEPPPRECDCTQYLIGYHDDFLGVYQATDARYVRKHIWMWMFDESGDASDDEAPLNNPDFEFDFEVIVIRLRPRHLNEEHIKLFFDV